MGSATPELPPGLLFDPAVKRESFAPEPDEPMLASEAAEST